MVYYISSSITYIFLYIINNTIQLNMECPPQVCPSILTRSYSHLSFTVIITMLVWWIRYVAEVNTVVGCPSWKNKCY